MHFTEQLHVSLAGVRFPHYLSFPCCCNPLFILYFIAIQYLPSRANSNWLGTHIFGVIVSMGFVYLFSVCFLYQGCNSLLLLLFLIQGSILSYFYLYYYFQFLFLFLFVPFCGDQVGDVKYKCTFPDLFYLSFDM